MIAAERRTQTYPVWLPEESLRARPSGARPRPLAAGRRRPLFNPTASVMVMAVLLTLPALFFVSQRAHRSETGYSILRLQRELTQLRAENARLLSKTTALKSPQRIERYATTELGMAPPRLPQLAAITVGPAVAAVAVPPERRGALRLLGEWLGRSEAEAREPVR